MKPIPFVYRFVIGLLIALLVTSALVIWLDNPKPGTTAAQTTHQLTIDSVNRLWLDRNRAYEDSIQQVYADSAAKLHKFATTLERRAQKLEGITGKQQQELERLKRQAPAECKKYIDAYNEALDTCNSKAETWHTAYAVESLAHKQTLLKVNSLTRETAILDSINAGLKRTNTVLRDRNTTITNRAKRSLIKRNWLWVRGKWYDYVFDE